MAYIEKIVDALTGVEILRDYSPEQEADAKATIADLERLAKIVEAQHLAKTAVLVKLGLTADEVAALLG